MFEDETASEVGLPDLYQISVGHLLNYLVAQRQHLPHVLVIVLVYKHPRALASWVEVLDIIGYFVDQDVEMVDEVVGRVLELYFALDVGEEVVGEQGEDVLDLRDVSVGHGMDDSVETLVVEGNVGHFLILGGDCLAQIDKLGVHDVPIDVVIGQSLGIREYTVDDILLFE